MFIVTCKGRLDREILRVVDLSHTIPLDTQTFLSQAQTADTRGHPLGVHPFESSIYIVPHATTHVDAPSHFIENAKKIHEIEPDALIRDAVILDLSHKKAKEAIQDEDLEAAEERAGLSIRENEIVLLRTDWDRHFGTGSYVSKHPTLARSGAEFLELKYASAVGVDTPNIDHPDDPSFPAHTILLGKGILVIENLCNLNSLNEPRVKFIALPLRIEGAAVSPIRAIAIEG